MVAPVKPDAPLSWQGRLIKPGVRWLVRGALHANPVATKRKRVFQLRYMTFAQKGCHYSQEPLGGVPTEWVEDAKQRGKGVLLFLHGGGYVVGSPQTHRPITSRLALAAGVKVAAIDYRLAPEHPFPAALEDAVAAFKALIKGGLDARQIVVGGDSAGGGLALALALKLKELGLPQPGGLLLYSPWTDMSSSGESVVQCAEKEVMLSMVFTEEMRQAYVPGVHDYRQPLLSPLFADLSGLPPLFIQIGGQEILLSDALRLHDKALGAGLESQLEHWQACWHVWQLHAGVMPEADEALKRSAAFIRSMLARA